MNLFINIIKKVVLIVIYLRSQSFIIIRVKLS